MSWAPRGGGGEEAGGVRRWDAARWGEGRGGGNGGRLHGLELELVAHREVEHGAFPAELGPLAGQVLGVHLHGNLVSHLVLRHAGYDHLLARQLRHRDLRQRMRDE